MIRIWCSSRSQFASAEIELKGSEKERVLREGCASESYMDLE